MRTVSRLTFSTRAISRLLTLCVFSSRIVVRWLGSTCSCSCSCGWRRDLRGQPVEFLVHPLDLAMRLGALRPIQFDGGAGQRRLARRAIAVTTSRSRAVRRPSGRRADLLRCCRCVFRNNCGCSRSRWRTAGVASRQAAYNCPASRLVNRCVANASAMRRQSSGRERATGTRNFIATCAAIAPLRTCCCTLSGSSSTSPIRRDTQLVLRSKRRANSSSP